MLQTKVKKHLNQLKEQQENQLIKKRLIENRLSTIIDSTKGIGTKRPMSKKAKHDLGFKLYAEIHRLHKFNIISEQDTMTDVFNFIKGQFSNVGLSAVEGVIIEPLVNSILSKLGMGGYFKNFIISFLATNPRKVIDAFKNCDTMVSLISESLVEATFMMLQQKQDMGGIGYDVLRNAIGKAVKETKFVKDIESEISDVICDIFDELRDSVKGSLEQFGTEETT